MSVTFPEQTANRAIRFDSVTGGVTLVRYGRPLFWHESCCVDGVARSRRIGSILFRSFGSFAVIAVSLCLGLLVSIIVVERQLEASADSHATAQAGLQIALDAQEHFIHQAQVLGGTPAAETHRVWMGRLRADVLELARRSPEERDRLNALQALSEQLDDVFRNELVPALARGDASVATEAEARASAYAMRLSSGARELVVDLDARASHAYARAHRTVRVAVVLACLGSCGLFIFGWWLAQRIRTQMVDPLARLSAAADRLGGGQVELVAKHAGAGEVVALVDAFNRMAKNVERRELRLLRSEGMLTIGRLAAGVAHEINNPIGVIRGYLRTMLREQTDPELVDELRILDDEAAACERIVQDLLTFSRTPNLSVQETDIAHLIATSVERVSQGRPEKVTTEVEAAFLRVDGVRIRQVIANLVTNALQAGEAGVLVRGRVIGDVYEIVVEDEGPGVPPEDRDRIFEPFFTRTGGTGLGLAIVRSIVEAHGGTIAYVPREGGAAMQVHLPVEHAR